MKITAAMKSWLVEKGLAAENATDDEFKAAAAKALTDGTLTVEKMAELVATKDPEPEPAEEPILSETPDAVKAADVDAIVAKAVAAALAKAPDPESVPAPKAKEVDVEAVVAKAVNAALKARNQTPTPAPRTDSAVQPTKIFGNDGASMPNVIAAHKQYSTSTKEARYPAEHKHLAGQRAKFAGVPLDEPSELGLAVSGAFIKQQIARSLGQGQQLPRGLRMTPHDEELMKHAVAEMKWTGTIGEGIATSVVDNRRLTAAEKAPILDSSTSGGDNAVPIVFDQAVVLTPVLHGELFPLVNVVPIARGANVEGFKMNNPAWTSGTAEGTAITPIDTTAIIQEFNTTIRPVVGAVEIGIDFEGDSPVNIGQLLIQRLGETAMEWLDNQIANGDGSTEPTGIFTSSLTDIGDPTSGANGVVEVLDYERLLFGLGKQFRTPADRARVVYVGNDTTYQRARSIDVGSSDQRRVFGMDHESYQLLGHAFKIQNDIPNTDVGFVNLSRYRMYRRMGMTVRTETAGRTLALANTTLIVVRMRWGGKMELSTAGTTSDTWTT